MAVLGESTGREDVLTGIKFQKQQVTTTTKNLTKQKLNSNLVCEQASVLSGH